MKLSEMFYLNKNDRTVVIWLIAIVACVVGIFGLNDNNDEELASATAQGQVPRSGFGNGENSSRAKISEPQSSRAKISEPQSHQYNLHPFDLNTASPDELLALGFSEREIRSVMNYRAKGGIYRRVEQMSKISGVTKGEYDRLAPYFRVSDDFLPASDFVKVPKSKRHFAQSRNTADRPIPQDQSPQKEQTISPSPQKKVYPEKIKHGETIAINTSDTTALKRIPGVGSSYARMIANYREKLGGFVSVDQLNDLQMLPADIQNYLTLDPIPLRKIKVNTLPVNHLIKHPYITYPQAKAIQEYIQKNGPLKSIREMKLNKNFTDGDIKRLEPYMDYGT